jgi:hypothetical protein
MPGIAGAAPAASPVMPQVVAGVPVPIPAMRFRRLQHPHKVDAPRQVDIARDWLEVSRVRAPAGPAEVVKVKPFRLHSHKQLKDEVVHSSRAALVMNLPVAAPLEASTPQPTARIGFGVKLLPYALWDALIAIQDSHAVT